MKIKKNDTIRVTKGKDRGKSGKIEKVLPKLNKIVVTGINKFKKHIKPSKKNPHGGIVDVAMAIPVSNVSIVCPSCQKSTRVQYKITDSKKLRICKQCKQSLEG